MSRDRFLLAPVAMAEHVRRALPDAQEWSDDGFVVRWTGSHTTLAANNRHLVVCAGAVSAEALLPRASDRRLLQNTDEHAAGAVIRRTTGSVQAFRDLPGGSCVYVARQNARPVVGSSAEMLVSAGVGGGPSPLWIANILQNEVLEPAATPRADIADVLPGHVAEWRDGRWQQRTAVTWRRPSMPSDETAQVEGFVDVMKSAIRRQLGDATTAGVMLSGGQDSSLLLALAVEAAPDVKWQAYCIPFLTAAGDERARQKAVADHLSVPIKWVPVEGRSPLGQPGEALFGGLTGPPFTGNWFFGQAVAEHAAADGTAVVFDGEDADSLLFGDINYLADLAVAGRLKALRSELERWERITGVSVRTLARDIVHTVAPPGIRRLLGDRGPGTQVSPVLSPGFADQARARERIRARRTVPWRPTRQFLAARKTALELMLGVVLREVEATFNDFPVAVGHPYSDRRVIEYSLALPWASIVGRRPKQMLYMASLPRLPEWFVQSPSKAQLNEYWDAAVTGFDAQRVDAGLSALRQRPELVNVDEVDTVAERWRRGDDLYMAARLAGLGLWLDQPFE